MKCQNQGCPLGPTLFYPIPTHRHLPGPGLPSLLPELVVLCGAPGFDEPFLAGCGRAGQAFAGAEPQGKGAAALPEEKEGPGEGAGEDYS